uniref:Malate dehydrogenase, mitochondrial n=1 Tax=Lygus hesperus TaxID=30085 RepID=A0A0A9XLN9_LYGHE
MKSEDLFNTNARIIHRYIQCIGEICPEAFVGLITDPIDSLVPVAAETLKKMNCYNKNKLFGITNIDSIRARTIVAHALQCSCYDVHVPVIGGHSSTTIVPVLSQFTSLSEEMI